MAANTKRPRGNVHYISLNNFSSVVLYDTARKPRGRFNSVDRVIERRSIAHSEEYLIKWSGWPMHACSWEPAEHITPELLRTYERPAVDHYRLEMAGLNFSRAILTNIKGTSIAPVDVLMDLDIQRYLWRGKGAASEHKGLTLYNREDFSRFTTLPNSWWCHLDSNGQGTAIDFPLKMKSILSWTPAHYVKEGGKLRKGPVAPIEKLKLHFAKKACCLESI